MDNLQQIKFMTSSFELFQALEDEAECSGMCDVGLFYFGRSISDTPPQVTCMSHFKAFVDHPCRKMSNVSAVAATLALFLSILHCFLMDRDEQDNSLFPPRSEQYEMRDMELKGSVDMPPHQEFD